MTPAPEQQGEPVCAKVQGTGTTWVCNRPAWYFMHDPEWSGWGKPGTGWHEFEPPAPPSSEEAEAQGAQFERKPLGMPPLMEKYLERWGYVGEDVGIYLLPVELTAAIRSPLEERIRELTEALRIAEANQDTLARVVDADGPLDRAVGRAEAAEAQVAKLREALEEAQALVERASLVMETALLPTAETVQEGGETQ